MTRRKLETMYKTMHLSYLEMANDCFGEEEKEDEEDISLMKQYEHFANDLGLFINQDPYLDNQNEYNDVKNRYVFEDVTLSKVSDVVSKKRKKP